MQFENIPLNQQIKLPLGLVSYVREIENAGYWVTLTRVASPNQKVKLRIQPQTQMQRLVNKCFKMLEFAINRKKNT